MAGPPNDPRRPVDFRTLARTNGDARAAWTARTEDLNLNLIVLGPGSEIGEHVNPEVDVFLVVVDGDGEVVVNGNAQRITAGQGIVIPKGASRSITCAGERFAYLTCHRRRAGLWPDR